MNEAHVIYHLARADFLERVRRYSFLIMLGLMLFLGYQVAAGNMTVALDEYRGEFNSAWIGATMAFFASFFLGIFGFYLVKGSIARDRETGVGQIMAATPMRRPLYMFGKWASNFAVLMAMVMVLAVAGIGIQFLAGENMQLDLPAMFAPHIFITMPLMAVVAAAALLFESINFLKGGFGNVIYFIVAFILFPAIDELSKVNPVFEAFEPVGTAILRRSMTVAASAAFPEYGGGFAPGNPAPPQTQVFTWTGVDWTLEIILTRLSFFLFSAVLLLGAIKYFDRFDSSQIKPKKKKMKTIASSNDPLPALTPQTLPAPRLTPLNTVTNRFDFFTILRAELELLIKGQRWWWYVIAGVLIIACYAVGVIDAIYSIDAIDFTITRKIILPIAWVWPLLIWSAIGNREFQYNVHQMTFSSISPLWRQLPAQWLAAFIITLVMGSGAILRLVIDGDIIGVLALLSGAIFIPSLALATGVWSRTSKLFEIVYMTIWYVGPIEGLGILDYLGANSNGNIGFFIPLSIALIVVAFIARARQLQN
jgi:hypothetical protein